MCYVLALDQLERQWHTETICAAMMLANGGEAEVQEWTDVVERFDKYLASEPAAPDEESEKRRLLGLK